MEPPILGLVRDTVEIACADEPSSLRRVMADRITPVGLDVPDKRALSGDAVPVAAARPGSVGNLAARLHRIPVEQSPLKRQRAPRDEERHAAEAIGVTQSVLRVRPELVSVTGPGATRRGADRQAGKLSRYCAVRRPAEAQIPAQRLGVATDGVTPQTTSLFDVEVAISWQTHAHQRAVVLRTLRIDTTGGSG